MENNVDLLLDKVSEHVKEMTKSETIIGEEFQMGKYTCKPVIRVGVGFASGGGTGDDPKHKCKGSGGGAGAGIGIQPVGFLVSDGDEINFISADKRKGISTLIEKMPDIVDKVMDIKDKKEGKKEDKKESK